MRGSSTSSRSPHVPDELLELRDPDVAFERLEAWLLDRGFFRDGWYEVKRP